MTSKVKTTEISITKLSVYSEQAQRLAEWSGLEKGTSEYNELIEQFLKEVSAGNRQHPWHSCDTAYISEASCTI